MTPAFVTRLFRLRGQPAKRRIAPARFVHATVPIFLLHGTGSSKFDELIIFGGIVLVLVVLGFLSWRAGRRRKKEKYGRRDSE